MGATMATMATDRPGWEVPAHRAASGDTMSLTHLLFHAFAPHFEATTVTCDDDTVYVLTELGRLGLKIVERPEPEGSDGDGGGDGGD